MTSAVISSRIPQSHTVFLWDSHKFVWISVISIACRNLSPLITYYHYYYNHHHRLWFLLNWLSFPVMINAKLNLLKTNR